MARERNTYPNLGRQSAKTLNILFKILKWTLEAAKFYADNFPL